VAFEILPAIDVAAGRLVSMSSGRVRTIDAFGGSPLAAAETFVSNGARWLHVVDVDRALGGRPDLALLASIAALGAAVQASGGIEDPDAAGAALEAGAARVVLGSSMLAGRDELLGLVGALGDRAVVGIEADGPVIRPRSGAAELPLDETLGWLEGSGARRYLYTGVARVAGLGGPDAEGIAAVARRLGRPVVAAGGIGRIDDVLAVRDLGPAVAEGVVVGRALYEGLDLRALLDAVG
jgi:phosphoribosylformimino-5-aminoimidazole carboxamide ribonucleotide (ProFAR) isomerase